MTFGEALKCAGGALLLAGVLTATAPQARAAVYYVDCGGGSDSNNGGAMDRAWKTLAKANAAGLSPGDQLLLKRGCAWDGVLTAKWNGAEASPVLISAYGDGADPLIRHDALGTDDSHVAVQITGSYQIVEHIRATLINPVRDAGCLQPDGEPVRLGWYVGFSISGHHNVLRQAEADHQSLGVFLTDESSHNQVLNGYLHDLDALWRLDPVNGALGALGVNLHGDDNEVAYMLMERNNAECTMTDGTHQDYSAPFELYNANRSLVHHNRAFGHRKHFEMGKDAGSTADDNVFAYNLMVSTRANARGPNIHGEGNPFGPVNRTGVYNNTIVLTGAETEAMICSCTGGATVRNNVFIAERKSAYFGGTVSESQNVFWDYGAVPDAAADPFVQFTSGSMDPTSLKADPRLADPSGREGNYRLGPTSPAIDKGVIAERTWPQDLDGTSVPQGSVPDPGAYEFAAVDITPPQRPRNLRSR